MPPTDSANPIGAAVGAIPVYTKEDVAKHNTREDAWVSCNGFVFDVTSFIASHPGGADVLIQSLGKDIRQDMIDTDHSPYAFTFMKDFTIGTMKGEQPHEMFPAPEKQMRGYTITEIRNCVDFNKPVLQQLVRLDDKYWPWIINRPVVHHMRIFEYDWMEFCSRWPWWYIWVIWPPVISFGIISSILAGFSFLSILTWFFVGILSWSLCEYVLHRFAFHYPVSSNLGNFVHYFMHGVHHLTPTDSTRLTFPPPFATAIGYVAYLLFNTIMPSSLPANATFAGFTFGYLLYDTAHFFFHHSDFDNALFRYCKKAHLGHHYKEEDRNFGVTSPFWDLVFGSYDASNISSAPAHKKTN